MSIPIVLFGPIPQVSINDQWLKLIRYSKRKRAV
jgi:hypothetical protein